VPACISRATAFVAAGYDDVPLARWARSGGYLFRTRKSLADEQDDGQRRDLRSGKYLFRFQSQAKADLSHFFLLRVRKEDSQIRSRKGGYLFRTRKEDPALKRGGGYLFRTRKSMDGGDEGVEEEPIKRGNYLFRTRKSLADGEEESKRGGAYLFRTRKRGGSYLFRTRRDPAQVWQQRQADVKRGNYLFRTRRDAASGGYLFRTR